MAKLPQVSGKRLIGFLQSLGYIIVRQKGSHVRLKKMTGAGEHHLTVPSHQSLAKGTLSDILSAVSIRIGIPKDELLKQLRS